MRINFFLEIVRQLSKDGSFQKLHLLLYELNIMLTGTLFKCNLSLKVSAIFLIPSLA